MTRVVEESKWSAKLVLQVKGVSGRMRPTADGELDPDDVEAHDDPHEFAEEKVGPREPREEVPPPEPESAAEEPVQAPVDEERLRRMRITQPLLARYGYTGGCIRCANVEYGNVRTKTARTRDCRLRIYRRLMQDKDHRWARAALDPEGKNVRPADKHPRAQNQ